MKEVENFLASHAYCDATKDSYRRIFKQLLDDTENPEAMTASELIAKIESRGWGNSQQCVAVAACRKYYRWRFGDDHPALTARIKARRPKPQRTLTVAKALELIMWFDASTPKGARDLAMACVLLDTGLRASEVCRLQLADTDLEKNILQVVVKGGQWGMGVFSERTGAYICAWLKVRRPAPGVGALFVHSRTGKQLTREGLQCIIKVWGAAIGVKLSPHDFRRSYATIASVFGAPSRLVQLGGRWSSIEMVEHYTRDIQADAIRPYLPVGRLIPR